MGRDIVRSGAAAGDSVVSLEPVGLKELAPLGRQFGERVKPVTLESTR